MAIMYHHGVRVIASCIAIFVVFLSMYWIFYRWIEFIGVASLLFASVFLHYHTIITSYPWIFDGYHVPSWCSCDCIMHRNICGVSIDVLNLLASLVCCLHQYFSTITPWSPRILEYSMAIMCHHDVRVITSCIAIFVAFLSMDWIYWRC